MFFSIPLLIAFLIPVFVQIPTFPAAGSVYLRTGSLPDLSLFDIGIMLFSYLVSLYLISFAIVNINLVIKSQRTSVNIRKEILKGLGGYTLNVFWLYLTFTLILFVIQLITFTLEMQNVLAPILGLIAVLPFFYAPAALVIDNIGPERAIKASLRHIKRKIPYFILWLVVGFILISIIDLLILNINVGYESLLVIVINSILIAPFMIVMQTQMYLSKYSLIH